MTYVKVRVLTAQRREAVEAGEKDGELKVYVRAKPERGAANRRVLELVRAHLGNPDGGVKIVSGHTAPSKVLRVGR